MYWRVDRHSRTPLQEQIAGCVRGGIASGSLVLGEQLPPAAELAEALSVDRNTVLAAYRQLRADGLLEFRRGRGARVARGAQAARGAHEYAAVVDTARELVEAARSYGLQRNDLIQLIEELT